MADPFKYKRMRVGMRGDDPMHEVAAPIEHREFAQGFVEDNPVLGPLSLAFAIPGYAAYKKLFKPNNRTQPRNFDQFFGGFQGLARGVKANLGIGPSIYEDEELER